MAKGRAIDDGGQARNGKKGPDHGSLFTEALPQSTGPSYATALLGHARRGAERGRGVDRQGTVGGRCAHASGNCDTTRSAKTLVIGDPRDNLRRRQTLPPHSVSVTT
jgi:hypothetical protein